ncbi:hypothetical protein MFIFM68171_08168 [Madurella fahalii]|uniref:AAA+ ATPase domain-containing protein n=1 Tax=Madurella fahalii TaxID=1157608 RepID=A0ABQ0GJP0_9PEZI
MPQPPATVQRTISEDRTAGHAAHAESGFSGLAAPRHQLPGYQASMKMLEQQYNEQVHKASQLHEDARRRAQAIQLQKENEAMIAIKDVVFKEGRLKGNEGQAPASAADATGEPHLLGTNHGYVVLYRVVCHRNHMKCSRRVWEDEPQNVVIDGDVHLAGKCLVADLSAFIVARGPTAFIVYRDSYCGSHAAVDFTQRPSTSTLGTQGVREVISVISRELHAAIQKISTFAPDDAAYPSGNRPPGVHMQQGTSSLGSRSPFEYSHYFFYHHLESIRQAAVENPCARDFRPLFSYLQTRPDPMYDKCDELFGQGLVTSETLPWLFRPNEVLVCEEDKLAVAYVLRWSSIGSESNGIDLDCWNWGYDGNFLRRKDKNLRLTAPTYDAIPIPQLPVYPLRYADGRTKQQLLKTGTRFSELMNQTHVAYEGLDYRGERIYPPDSRCMIDYQMYRKFHALADAFSFSTRPAAMFDQWPQEISVTTKLCPSNLMLLPPGIHGFFLKDKKWVYLLVENIRPVHWNKEAFERLVLPRRIKNLVKALVLVRKADAVDPSVNVGLKGMRSDLIRGKGGGLIMLLHGGPGTGKTLTAESVAELAEMPLYNVTCGDIGTKPEAVEQYLNSVLHLGQKWNCVLLLDEADVFLEQRSLSDLERNSLVSVFLRTLEYYDGVLILTSNRVGTFDAAFKSRIQVALHYPVLDRPSRHQIWQNFLEILRADNEDIDFDGIAAHMDELADQEMNGRQIRNVVMTARQLAMFEKTTVAWDHLEQAISAASDFDKHLHNPRFLTDEEWIMDTETTVSGAAAIRNQSDRGLPPLSRG